MRKVCVVVPTRNEENTIKSVIEDIRAALPSNQYKTEILIIDDSRDKTREIALKNGAHVVKGPGEGLGIAMYRGLKASLTFKPDIILAIDGDGQADCTEVSRFLAPIESGKADMVLGSRFLDKDLVKYHYKFINRLGTIILSWFLKRGTGLPLTDSHGGLRAMRPEVVQDLEMIGTHTYVQETILDAAQKHYRITEIPSVWKEREHGKSRVVGSIPKYIFYTLPVIILKSGEHIRLLYSSGIIFCLLGFLLFLGVWAQESFSYAMGNRTPAFILIALFETTGLQLFFFGFILQLMQQNKRATDAILSTVSPNFQQSIIYHHDYVPPIHNETLNNQDSSVFSQQLEN